MCFLRFFLCRFYSSGGNSTLDGVTLSIRSTLAQAGLVGRPGRQDLTWASIHVCLAKLHKGVPTTAEQPKISVWSCALECEQSGHHVGSGCVLE